MEIFGKLLAIQGKLKAPKGQYNSFGKYAYRSCEDILEALKPLLAEHKCALVITDTLENIGERYYVKATATLTDVENSGQVQNTAYAREEETKKGMDGSQITGAASSYARKYALNGLFGIDDTKDSDSTNKHGTGDSEPSESKLVTDTRSLYLEAREKFGQTELDERLGMNLAAITKVMKGKDADRIEDLQTMLRELK